MKKFNLVVSGGTFDRLHKGHAAFLSHQLAISENVLVGITSDTYAHTRKHASIEPYATREKAVRSFLKDNKADARVKIAPIDDISIPEVWGQLPIEAIVVTEVTKSGAEAINEERRKKGQTDLPIELFRMQPADDGTPISSSRIRKGEINRDGTTYISKQIITKNFSLPESLRDTLKVPFGELIINNAFSYDSLAMEKVITVGDVATKTFLERGLHPHIAIIDFVVERKKQYENPKDIGFSGKEIIITADNPAGMITTSLLNAIQKAFEEKSDTTVIIIVTGEEDLAVIPALLLSPLGQEIFYGQPGQGIVQVHVQEEQKELALRIFHKLKNTEN